MLVQSPLTSRRRKGKGKKGEGEERTSLSIRREELEVPINGHAVDWTTDLGRRCGQGSDHAFLISQGYLHDYRAQVDNKYFPKYEFAIREQEKNAKALMKERNRVLTRGSEPIHSVSESEEERPFDVESMELEKLVRQAEDLSRMPWYDPGLILLYRKIISDINKLEIEWAGRNPTLPIVRQSEFVLNAVNIKGGKEEVSTRNLGRDDILQRLDRLEGGGSRVGEEEEEVEDGFLSSSSLVSSMEDLCDRAGTLNLSRKRSHEDSTEVDMSIEGEKEVEEAVFYSSEGRPDASNVLYKHSLFSGAMKDEDSKVYIVVEPVTKSLYALISMGAFTKKENLHRFVVDMDLREKFDMPNVYKELVMNWARIGYGALKRYLQGEMDLPEEPSKEEEEGENFLDSITSSMDTLKRVRKARIPVGYKKASEFILEQSPFYPDCVLSNMTARFGKLVPGAQVFHRGIAPEEGGGYYLHVSVKICKLPLIVTATPKSWEAFTETLNKSFEEEITDHQRILNFVTRDDTWLEKPRIGEMLAYKLVECVLYSHMVKSNDGFSPVDFVESLVYTYTTAEGEDSDECSLFVGSAPVYIDYLAMNEKEQDEYSEEDENFVETFQGSVRRLEGGLPLGVFEHISEMLYCDEGQMWILDILAYWRSVLEEKEEENNDDEFTMDHEALRGILHRFTKLPTVDRLPC
jgi:hypothetical protein